MPENRRPPQNTEDHNKTTADDTTDHPRTAGENHRHHRTRQDCQENNRTP